ncbi:MAG: hypothetical protein AAGF47_07040 [Planctomycetota bacterium]
MNDITIIDMMTDGANPGSPVRTLDDGLTVPGRWIAGNTIGEPVNSHLARMHTEEATEIFEDRLREWGLLGTDMPVLLDCEHRWPHESARLAMWFDAIANAAELWLRDWSWYLCPYPDRNDDHRHGFDTHDGYLAWLRDQVHFACAPCLNAVLYMGPSIDPNDEIRIAKRVINDPHLTRALTLGRQADKPVRVLVRPDTLNDGPGKGRELSRRSLIAYLIALRERLENDGRPGHSIAVWNQVRTQQNGNAPIWEDDVSVRRWADETINPAIEAVFGRREAGRAARGRQNRTSI